MAGRTTEALPARLSLSSHWEASILDPHENGRMVGMKLFAGFLKFWPLFLAVALAGCGGQDRHLCGDGDCHDSCVEDGYITGVCEDDECRCINTADGDADGDSDGDPCATVDCSGHGECGVFGGEPRCVCDDGYRAEGLNCVPESTDGDADADSDIESDRDLDHDIDGDADRDHDFDGDSDADADTDEPCVPGCDGGPCEPGQWATICAGTFVMGSPPDELGRYENEVQHEVTLTHDFEILTTEVARNEFAARMGYDPSLDISGGSNRPVNGIHWSEAAAYCNQMSEEGGLESCYECIGVGEFLLCNISDDYETPYECPGYRLPTEAEWEYAARAGTTTATYNGDFESPDRVWDVLGPIANCSWDSMQLGGLREPNNWGLYDIIGNLMEFCHDWFEPYPTESITDPHGARTGTQKIIRGGRFRSGEIECRSAFRGRLNPEDWREVYMGFRVVRTMGE